MAELEIASVSDFCEDIETCLAKAAQTLGDEAPHMNRALVLALTGCLLQLDRIADALDDHVGRA